MLSGALLTVRLSTPIKLMPMAEKHWALFNHMVDRRPPPQIETDACMSYNIRNLSLRKGQNVTDAPFLITLNLDEPPRTAFVKALWEYHHPLLDKDSLTSQKHLSSIQNVRNISFCGSWTGYGLLEDGIRSAVIAARNHLGAEINFHYADPKTIIQRIPTAGFKEQMVRFCIIIVFIWTCIFGCMKFMFLGCLPFGRKLESNGVLDHEKEH